MNETHQARAPTVPRTGRPNREPLDADEVISYALVLAGDLGVSIPKRKRLYRMLKRRIPIPQIYQGADYRLWVDRYYIAAQCLADESVRYVYLTRIHIRNETLADQRMKRLYGVPLLDSEPGMLLPKRWVSSREPFTAFIATLCGLSSGSCAPRKIPEIFSPKAQNVIVCQYPPVL